MTVFERKQPHRHLRRGGHMLESRQSQHDERATGYSPTHGDRRGCGRRPRSHRLQTQFLFAHLSTHQRILGRVDGGGRGVAAM